MSTDSHNIEKKTLFPLKYEEMLRNVKEDTTNRDRVCSNYEIYSKDIESYKERSAHIENALKIIKNLEFKNGEPTLIS